MTQPTHTATIAAMLADIESNAVRTSQQNRDHAILTILAETIARVEALETETQKAVAYCEFMSIFEDTQIPINEKHAGLIGDMNDGIREAIRQVNENFASMAETISALRAENVAINTRLDALESWREMQTGDGR